ncbi:hypothetical protein Cgig2_004598 [Carnegiea gigantea]|uniref:DUF4283 domain-containing protein n=1 Tax=Carnegiea gigantea TaxID=171969 RepID=A0A9Q1GN36_9CARY|nr:hypothetical protein Cgig2_004598 [Carnegiea gigantea]
MGANPPFGVIEGFIRRIWKDKAIDEIVLVRKGVYMVRFLNEQDKLEVMQKGLYYFDNKPFLFLELDIKYWGLDSLSKIGSILGILIKTDKYTKEKINDSLSCLSHAHTDSVLYYLCVWLQSGTPETPLWDNLQNISNGMNDAWCVLGDFNAILTAEDRMGGAEINRNEECGTILLLDYQNSVDKNRQGYNQPLWYDVFDFTQATYLANGLYDCTPIIIEFLHCPRIKPKFSYYDMWSTDPSLSDIIEIYYRSRSAGNKLYQLKHLLSSLKKDLMKLNKNKFSDLHAQQVKARNDLTHIQQQLLNDPYSIDLLQHEASTMAHYIKILISWSNADWIRFGDDCTRHFFFRVKQRKLDTYIYTITDKLVLEVMFTFYKDLLGIQLPCRSHIDQEVVHSGILLAIEQQLKICAPFKDTEIKEAMFSIPNCKSPGLDGYSSGFFKATWDSVGHLVCEAIQELFPKGYIFIKAHDECSTVLPFYLRSQSQHGQMPNSLWGMFRTLKGFQEGKLPLKYLGVPVIASKLSKLDCSMLVDKILAKVKIWSSRNISFADRTVLINIVLFGMINYWASIFILAQEKHSMGGMAEFKRIPHVAWNIVCTPKSRGAVNQGPKGLELYMYC